MAVTIGGMSGHFELNVFKPMMAYNLINSARLLGDACQSFNDNCAIDIEPNYIVIEDKLEKSLLLVTALNPHIGYDKAAHLAHIAYETGKTVREVAMEENILPEDELKRLLDPVSMTGPSS